MYSQLDDMQTRVDAVTDIPVFGYVNTALDHDDYIPGHNEYSDGNYNNIPLTDGTELSLQEREKGFRNTLSSLSRAFFTHFFGRSSFNVNKLKELMSSMLGTYKQDYTHNFRKWDNTAVYAANDVCFLVAYGIRYCFKSLVNNNTASISAAANGTLSYDTTKWSLLTEVREVKHPIGKPFLWFSDTMPSSDYINFSNGAHYNWASYPALNTAEFKALLTRFNNFGNARTDSTGFFAPTISELYPMSYNGDLNKNVTKLSKIAALVPDHTHALTTGTPSDFKTNGTTNTDHKHLIESSNDAGSHQHYVGDYQSTQHSVDTPNAWHEDSKFRGGFVYEGTGDEYSNIYEDYRVYLTPNLSDYTFPDHSIGLPQKSLSHTHSGTNLTPKSGAGDFNTASGQYRPGTIKTILVVRAR